MSDFPKINTVSGDSVSFVWAEIVRALLAKGCTAISPLTVVIEDTGGEFVPEDDDLRKKADEILAAVGGEDVETVAWTIFPQRHWQIMNGDRQVFLEEACEAYPRVREMDKGKNGRGTYFQRLVDYAGDGSGPHQLKYLLDKHDTHPSARQSMWQAMIFDPRRDHTASAQLQFPCLQQVSLSFTDEGRIVLHAFYATQQIVHRGYGNYLGLMHLGRFLGDQMVRKGGEPRGFAGISVYVGTAKQDKIAKSHPTLADLPALLEKRLALSNNRVTSTLVK